MMKIRIFLNLMIGILIVFFFSRTLLAQIEVEQWLDKTEYVEGEPVFLFVRATNHTSVPVMFGIYYNTEINVYDSNGKKYEPVISGNYIYRENLFPDSTYESFANLAGMGDKAKDVFYSYFREGNYYVYIHWKDKGMEITTPKLYFRVKKPNKYQQQVFDEFLKVLKISQTRSSSDEGKILMKNLLEKYPNSIYVFNIYRLLWIYYRGEKIGFNLADQFVHRYPHHLYARTSLFYIKEYFRRKKDKEGAIQYFRKLLREKLDPGLNNNIKKNVLKRILNKPVEDW